MPTTPRHEDMRLDSSLNITPEGLLIDLPTAVGPTIEDGERKKELPEKKPQEAPSDTHLKTKPERDTREAPKEFRELERQVEKRHCHQQDNTLLK